jgi:Fur family transcriptional regulator, ferric uptake regulator
MPTPELLGQFRTFLHRRSGRVTPVREHIIRVALAKKGHFDVDELARDLRARGVEVSLATVYRALPLLVEAGLIEPTVSRGGRQRYERAAARPHHDHLLCTACGKLVEFQFEAFEVLQREVAAKYGFTLSGHSHQLFGECRGCRRRSRGKGQ